MDVSGVASFSPYRSLHGAPTTPAGRLPASASRSRANREMGWNGSSLTLGVGHDGQPLVEEVDQRPDDAGLRLAALTQQDHVVSGQHGVLELGEDTVLEPEHPGDQGFAGGDPGRGVPPDLLGHRDRGPARLAQAAQRGVQRCPGGGGVSRGCSGRGPMRGRRYVVSGLRRGHGVSLRQGRSGTVVRRPRPRAGPASGVASRWPGGAAHRLGRSWPPPASWLTGLIVSQSRPPGVER